MDGVIESDGVSEDEFEAAYRQALEASEAAEAVVAEHEAAAVSDSVDLHPQPPPRPATPDKIVEAALFVGGDGVSPEKLALVLDLEDGGDRVAAIVAAINARYDRQGRPYEISLREGVYVMRLRRDFDAVRDRLTGRAPKEVTLPPEVVALMSVIAYEQPVGPERLGKVGVDGWKAALRQVVRRGLVEATDDGYVTTDRFLDVFGLRDLDEMPRPETLERR